MNATETPLTCARHPKVETGLRCGRCETPICPKCAVYTPVGVKCPDCARNKSALFTPSALNLVLAGIAALFGGVAAGWIIGVLDLGFISLFLAAPYGAVAGELVLRVCGRKRGRVLEILTGVAFGVGAVGGRIVIGYFVLHFSPGLHKTALDLLLEAFQPLPFAPIAMGIALSAAVSRIRYL